MVNEARQGGKLIVVDALPCETGGGPVYLRNLFPALPLVTPDYHYKLLVSPKMREQLPAMPGNATIEVDIAPPVSSSVRAVWEQVCLPRWLRRVGADMLFSPFNIAPLRLKIPSLLTVHVNLTELRRFVPKHLSLKFHLKDRLVGTSARRASRVIAVSGMVRDFLVSGWSISPERIRVIYHATAEHFKPGSREASRVWVAERYGVRPSYVLMVADIYEHKNIMRVVEAFAGLPEVVRGSHDLVLAGRAVKPGYLEAVRGRARELGLADHFHWVGMVRHEELAPLYQGAVVSILPSLNETFGIPVAESMACGTPVVVSNIPALSEVGGDAVLKFDPLDVEGMRGVLLRVMTEDSLRRSMQERGLKRASVFSPANFVEKTHAVLEEVLSGAQVGGQGDGGVEADRAGPV